MVGFFTLNNVQIYSDFNFLFKKHYRYIFTLAVYGVV
jgi:hypothetical protein